MHWSRCSPSAWRGQGDDGDVAAELGLARPDDARGGEAVELRHLHVHEDDLEALLADGRQDEAPFSTAVTLWRAARGTGS